MINVRNKGASFERDIAKKLNVDSTRVNSILYASTMKSIIKRDRNYKSYLKRP